MRHQRIKIFYNAHSKLRECVCSSTYGYIFRNGIRTTNIRQQIPPAESIVRHKYVDITLFSKQ